MMRAEAIAKEALRTLGKEDLLFTHHADVHARPGAYLRLAEFFVKYHETEKKAEQDDA